MLAKIGLILLAIVLAALAFPLALSSKMHIERKVSIQTSPAAIYAVLIDMNQFRSWDPWSPMDEGKGTFKVEGQGVGQKYSWEGEKTGQGSMEITATKENESIDIRMVFLKPFNSVAQVAWVLTAGGNGATEVLWSYDQNMPYFQRYFGMFMDKMVGAQFETGLNKLKAKLEGLAPPAEIPS